MEILSVSDYRNNLSSYFDKASEGERVLIRRKKSIYALVSIESEDLSLSAMRQQQIDELTDSIRQGLNQAKQIEAGELPRKSAMDFINEL